MTIEAKTPKTFGEMLDAEGGNLLQRAARAYIKPRNAERTVKVMEVLQVDHIQNAAIKLARRIHERSQTNYTLGDNTLNSLVDFATNQTTINEAVHLAVGSFNAANILPKVATGRLDVFVVIHGGLLLGNTCAVLAQRYTRARLSRVIDHALARGKKIDAESFTNPLGIRLPTGEET